MTSVTNLVSVAVSVVVYTEVMVVPSSVLVVVTGWVVKCVVVVV